MRDKQPSRQRFLKKSAQWWAWPRLHDVAPDRDNSCSQRPTLTRSRLTCDRGVVQFNG